MAKRSVISVGTFDGVHLGHAALANRARRIAAGSHDAEVVFLVFDPPPREALTGERVPRLTTFDQREAALLAAGVDRVTRLTPDRALLGLSAEAFIRTLIDEHSMAAIVEGPDFHFGKGREGDITTLRQFGSSLGFEVEIVPPTDVVLSNHIQAPARSSTVRWLLERGRVADAALVLGRPYEMVGTVEQGDQRGRTMNMPTANLSSLNMTPFDGVYGGVAELPDGSTSLAAISVGTKPTFGSHPRTAEAYLFQQGLDGRAETLPLPIGEYGWTLRIRFTSWIREQLWFPDLRSLQEQIARDVESIVRLHSLNQPRECAA